MELIQTFEKATGVKVNYKIVGRREGDIEKVWANPEWANKELGWEAKYGIDEMCADSWRWQSSNPNGYGDQE